MENFNQEYHANFSESVTRLPETELHSSSERIAQLYAQKVAAEEDLNSKFWPNELDDASTYKMRKVLTDVNGSESTKDLEVIPARVELAMEGKEVLQALDLQIDQMYDEDPILVEDRIKEILNIHFTTDKLAVIQKDGLLWRDHSAHPNTVPLYNSELVSLLSKYEKHNGYAEGQGQESPMFDFVEGYVSQLTAERADAVAAFDALSPEEKERYPDKQTVREKLSYQDADLPQEQLEVMLRDAEGKETAEKYARSLNQLPQEEIDRAILSLKGQTKKVLDSLGVPLSPYGQSDSWAYWDLGKQQYYFEQNKDREPDVDDLYRYAPASEKLDEISDRHIGWEFFRSSPEVRELAFESIKDTNYLARAFEVLQSEPKADGQLESYKYAELGKLLREYVRTKDLKTT